mgnify:CR=1 FL=1
MLAVVVIWFPFLYIRYPVTAVLSVALFHARLICELLTAVAVSPVTCEGGVASTGGGGGVPPYGPHHVSSRTQNAPCA